MHALQGEGVKAGVVHGRGDGHGRGCEVLHLLRVHVIVTQVLGQLDHVLDGAAGMAGHEIGQKVLLLSRRPADCGKALPEGVQHLAGRLMHTLRHRPGDVLGSDLEVAGDVMAAQLLQIGRTVGHDQVMPDARADEDLLDAGNLPQIGKELHQPGMVFVQRGAVCRAEPVRAGALLPARAGEGIHVGGRPAHVLDDALEALHLREGRRLAQDGAFAAALHNPAPGGG